MRKPPVSKDSGGFAFWQLIKNPKHYTIKVSFLFIKPDKLYSRLMLFSFSEQNEVLCQSGYTEIKSGSPG